MDSLTLGGVHLPFMNPKQKIRASTFPAPSVSASSSSLQSIAVPRLLLPNSCVPSSTPLGVSNKQSHSRDWGKRIWEQQNTQHSFRELKEVVDDYNHEASARDWIHVDTHSITCERVLQEARNEQSIRYPDYLPRNVGQKVIRGLDKFCASAYNYSTMIDVLVNQAPEYTSLAWGAIKFLLIVNINSQELKESVAQVLGDIGDKFRMVKCFLDLFPSREMVEHVCGAYEQFSQFLTKAVSYYKECRLKRIFKNIGQPYAIRFQPIVNRMDIYVNKIKEQVQIGQGLAIVGNTQTLREHTQNLAAIKWGISEGNHRVLSAMEEQLEENRRAMLWQHETLQYIVKQNTRETPDQVLGGLLETRCFIEVFKLVFPVILTTEQDFPRCKKSIRALKPRISYQSLGLLDRNDIRSWVESHRSELLWIDGYRSQPDWTTSFAVDLIDAAKENGNVVLHYICSEHNVSSEFNHPTIWVKTFVFQLIQQRSDFFNIDQQKSILGRLLAVQNNFGSLWQVLVDCLQGMNVGFIYVVVNNVDMTYGSPTIRKEVQSLIRGLHQLARLEKRVIKILVTSRQSSSDLISAEDPETAVVHIPIAYENKKARRIHPGTLEAVKRPWKPWPDRVTDRDMSISSMLTDSSFTNDSAIEENFVSSPEDISSSDLPRSRKRMIRSQRARPGQSKKNAPAKGAKSRRSTEGSDTQTSSTESSTESSDDDSNKKRKPKSAISKYTKKTSHNEKGKEHQNTHERYNIIESESSSSLDSTAGYLASSSESD